VGATEWSNPILNPTNATIKFWSGRGEKEEGGEPERGEAGKRLWNGPVRGSSWRVGRGFVQKRKLLPWGFGSAMRGRIQGRQSRKGLVGVHSWKFRGGRRRRRVVENLAAYGEESSVFSGLLVTTINLYRGKRGGNVEE